MPSHETNPVLKRISVAAKTALAHGRDSSVLYSGLSIRARARIALVAAFLVAAPTLFVGVMRTENVSMHAARLSEYDDYWKRILETRIAIKELDLAIWAYSTEREFENGQAVLLASEYLKQAITTMVNERPHGLDLGPKGFFIGLVARLDGLIKRSIANTSSMAQARLSIMSMSNEVGIIEKRVIEIAQRERILALGSLSMVGRDQLILFLVLLFAVPIFVGFVPSWLVAPLVRLRQIASKIEMGQLKDLPATGKDEVAVLTRNLKQYVLKKEELDSKKSSKIFEMRNILRSVINRVNEPVFILDGTMRINYTNEAAAILAGIPPHQMEGKNLSDCLYSPVLRKLCEKAFEGENAEEATSVNFEVASGRTHSAQVKIGVVRDREGEISRAVFIFHPEQLEPQKAVEIT